MTSSFTTKTSSKSTPVAVVKGKGKLADKIIALCQEDSNNVYDQKLRDRAKNDSDSENQPQIRKNKNIVYKSIKKSGGAAGKQQNSNKKKRSTKVQSESEGEESEELSDSEFEVSDQSDKEDSGDDKEGEGLESDADETGSGLEGDNSEAEESEEEAPKQRRKGGGHITKTLKSMNPLKKKDCPGRKNQSQSI